MNERPSDPLEQLPHRPPFRFITKILAIEPGVRGLAEWHVQGDEWFLSGHFPGSPIVPGVLIAEALAQLSGLVAAPEGNFHDGRLAHVDVRFEHTVAPPAVIQLESHVSRSMGQLVLCEVHARRDEKVCARGSLTIALLAKGPLSLAR